MKTLILLHAAVIILLAAPAMADDREDCLRKMENLTRGVPANDLEACVATIVSNTERGDSVVWRRLRNVIIRDDVKTPVRLAALEGAIRIADERIASDLLDLGRQWAAVLVIDPDSPGALTADRSAGARSTLLSTLIKDGIPGLEQHGADARKLLDFVTEVAKCESLWISIEARQASYSLISKLSVPPEAKRASALTVLRERRGWQQVPDGLLDALDKAALAELHQWLQESLKSPIDFHWAAAAALAHYGYEDAVGTLQRAREQSAIAGADGGGMLEYYIWQIEVQEPETGLVQYIASSEDLGMQKRLWAVRRASQAGLSKERIRDAILQHATLAPRDANGIQQGLSSLKALAVSLNILRASDLPDVKTASICPAASDEAP
jgi:hypothetical protein